MSIIGNSVIHQTVNGDDGVVHVGVEAIEGVVQIIKIKRMKEESGFVGEKLFLPHDNTIQSLVSLRDMISQVIQEAQRQGIG